LAVAVAAEPQGLTDLAGLMAQAVQVYQAAVAVVADHLLYQHMVLPAQIQLEVQRAIIQDLHNRAIQEEQVIVPRLLLIQLCGKHLLVVAVEPVQSDQMQIQM
jgi:hypothetical protein